MTKLPDEWVAQMFADYRRLGSLKEAAALHGRSLATLWRLFVYRGLIQPKPRSATPERVAAMWADYQSGMSLEEVGRKWGRTRQTVFTLFKKRGLPLRAKVFLPVIEYRGRRYTSQKTRGRHRYLRDTNRRGRGAEVYLHRVIWEEHHGPIPPGHKVAFKDGNHLNVALDNIVLLTNAEQVRKYACKGHNQFTVTADTRLAMLLGGRGAEALRLKGVAA